MNHDWKEVTIGEITSSCLGKMLDKSKNKGEYQPYLANVNVRWGGFDLSNLPTMRFEESEQERYGLKYGDIVLCEGGEPGRCAIWKEQLPNIKIQKALHRIRTCDDVNNVYLYYWFLWAGQRGFLKSYFTGTTIQHLPGDKLKSIRLHIPPKDYQNRVATILSSLDDKIELNNQINENLQQQAQAIHQMKFHRNQIESEMGMLSDICQYSTERIDLSILNTSSYYSTENMLPNKEGAVRATSLPKVSCTTKCQIGDTLVSNIRPYFKKIVYCVQECGCSTDVLCFRPRKPDLSAYVYNTLYNDRFFEYMVAGSKGTKMPMGDKQQIMRFPVYIPTADEVEKYNRIAQPFLKGIENNKRENSRLSKMRDTLLPRLICGDISLEG